MPRDPIRPSPAPPAPITPTPPYQPAEGPVSLHHVTGHELTITPDGPRFVVTGIVEGLRGDEWQKLISAAANPQVPDLWSYHPVMTDVPLTNIQIRPASDGSPDTAHVTLTYAYPQSGTGFINPPDASARPQIEISTTVSSKDTHFWTETERNGDSYTFTQRALFVYETESDFTTSPKNPQHKKVTFYEPSTVFRYSRREPAFDSRGRTPGQKSRRYTGCVNMDTVFGDPPGYWLCTGITAMTDDGGATYNVSYEFQYNRDSWDGVVIATISKEGVPTSEPVPIVFPNEDGVPVNADYAMLKRSIYPARIFEELDLFF